MDAYTVAVIVLGIINFFGGVLIKILWGVLNTLRMDNEKLAKDLHDLEKLVAGDYVKRAEFEKSFDRLYEKLDEMGKTITSRIDGLSLQIGDKLDKSDYHDSLNTPRR